MLNLNYGASMENDYKVTDLNTLFERIGELETICNSLNLVVNELNEGSTSYTKPFLTVADAADYLEIKQSTIYTYANNGKIGHYRPGKKLYFSFKDLDEFALNENTHFKSDRQLKAEAVTRNVIAK